MPLILALLAGCGERAEAPAAAADTLVIAVSGDPKDLVPILATSPADNNLLSNLQYTPVEASFDCALSVAPRLYRSWSFSEDGRLLRVELREGMAWEDGAPVTAEDVAATYALVADPAVGSPRREAVRRMDPAARPRVLSPTTLEFGFTEPYDRTLMLEHAALDPIPAHALRDADPASLRGHALNVTAPLSKGPWRVAAWSRGQQLVLEPNPRFGGPEEERPRLARVVLRVLPDAATRVLELENGSVDLVENVAVAEVDRLAPAHPELDFRRRGWRSLDVVAWNALDPADWAARAEGLPKGEKPTGVAAHPLFGDREARRALASAIDTDALIRALLTSSATGEVYGRPAVGTISPAHCDAHADDVARLPFDPAAARARLGELGWTDTDGDGWLDRGGRTFRFSLLVGAGNPRRGGAAVMVQAQLRTIGVDATVETLDSAALNARLRKRDFDAALTGWSAALTVDPGTIWLPDAENNVVGYANADVTALVEQGRKETDPAAANPTWREVQARIYADQPYAFLYWADEIVAVHRRFRDARIDLLSPWRDLNRWWVAAGEERRVAP